MRLILAAVLIAAAAWSGFWWFGARSEAADLRDWFEAQDGASFASLETTGFPNRFDTTIDAPRLESGDVRWSAPFVQTLRLSYRPDHYILALADTQRLELPAERIGIETDSAQASVVFANGMLDHTAFVFDEPRFSGASGWNAAAARALFATRRTGEDIEIGLQIDELDLGDDARFALHAEGTVRRDADGALTGTVTLSSADWDALLGFATARGWLSRTQFSSLPRDDRDIDLVFRDGVATLGPVELGAVPSLSLD